MTNKRLKESEIIDRWNLPGAEGFFNWLDDIQPQVIHANNRYAVFNPATWQIKSIESILKVDSLLSWVYSLSLLIWPRRHSKSTIFALIVLWLFTSRKNHTIQCLGNSDEHTERVQFRTLKNIIRHTPKLSKLIPEQNILKTEITNPTMGNIIQRSSVSLAASFGDKLNVLWVSDFHATPDLEPFNAYQAALLDSQGSVCFVDSNVDSHDGHVHALEKEGKENKSIFCSHWEYTDFEQYLELAPSWIDRAKAQRLQKTLLPAAFKRDILGQRSEAVNALFPQSIIELCKFPYKCPVDNILSITRGRKYVIGGGLDRSKPWSLQGDATIWTVTLKVASPEHGEPEYYILNQEKIFNASASLIKKAILRDHKKYVLTNVVLESYETSDIANWVSEQGISCEVITATTTNQMASFSELRRIASESRLHFPDTFTDLNFEMSTFVYTIGKGNNVSFGHESSKFHDDRVYSLNWSIYATRETVLSLYVMGNIQCNNRTPRRNLCFLMSGDVVPFCSYECRAYHAVSAMLKEYKRHRLEEDLTIAEFYRTKVKQVGAKIYQVA